MTKLGKCTWSKAKAMIKGLKIGCTGAWVASMKVAPCHKLANSFKDGMCKTLPFKKRLKAGCKGKAKAMA